MSIVVLDAAEAYDNISKALREKTFQRGGEVSYFELGNMAILPCRSCGACAYKSPGKCVFKDDMHEILHAIARSSTVIMLGPVRFGGYSSTLKKAVDKFMQLCLPSYTVKHGHMLHPARYGSKLLIGIGLQQDDQTDRSESFRKLVENNALNLQYDCKAIVLNPSLSAEGIYLSIDSVLKEVCG